MEKIIQTLQTLHQEPKIKDGEKSSVGRSTFPLLKPEKIEKIIQILHHERDIVLIELYQVNEIGRNAYKYLTYDDRLYDQTMVKEEEKSSALLSTSLCYENRLVSIGHYINNHEEPPCESNDLFDKLISNRDVLTKIALVKEFNAPLYSLLSLIESDESDEEKRIFFRSICRKYEVIQLLGL